MQSYRQLDGQQIVATLEQLRERIATRFPDANLRQLSEQELAVARDAIVCAEWLRRPHWPLRLGAGLAVVTLLSLLVGVAGITLRAPANMGLSDLVQTIEAGVNDVVFFGIAIFFIVSLERRVKRRRALALIHQLRSLAHIVDMHQLTKDPERLMSVDAEPIAADRRTSGADLSKYLDFCSELLSLASKIAALLVQHFDDDAVLAGVDEIETLTTGLSGKIWQKITIVERAALSARA
ncbi:MAG TPA: hypothetical protein VKH19_18710 [Gemmatimonadaceae bacterium]|nr:hypothetical protein [Gemmatimonadaceae bacterium]